MSQTTTTTTYKKAQRQMNAPPPYPFTGEGKQCDFCSTFKDRLWFFPVRAHAFMSPIFGPFEVQEGYWGACVMCRPIVENYEFALLVARAEVMNPAEPPLDKDLWRAHLTRMYHCLFECMRPEGPYLREAR